MSSTAGNTPDAVIVARVRTGDERVFRELFDRHSIPLTLFADRMLLAPDVAEEVVADVFLALWEARESFAPKSSVQSYLYRAVRNRALNVRRGQVREEARVQWLLQSDALPGSGGDAMTPDEMADMEDRARLVRRALERLREPRRTIVTLRWQRGLTMEEIAEVIGSTPAAVKMHVSRAMKQLRELLPDLLS